MFNEPKIERPNMYFCNYDFAKGWFEPNPKRIEERLKKDGAKHLETVDIIEEIEHEYAGVPSTFISSHTKDPKEIPLYIAHELAHWADYAFLNMEEFMEKFYNKEYGKDGVKEFLIRLRLETPGEILRKQYMHILSKEEPEIAQLIKEHGLELEKDVKKQNGKIVIDFGYPATMGLKNEDVLKRFIHEVKDRVPLSGLLNLAFEGLDPEIEKKYGQEFKRIREGDATECLGYVFPFLKGQTIYSKKKLLSKIGLMLYNEDKKDEIINKIAQVLERVSEDYCTLTLDNSANIISYLQPDKFVIPKERLLKMKERFNEEDCYKLLQEVYFSK